MKMVTRAGKKLLRNTIHTVDHHNKVLEEQDMWRQWELQQALTMMVSDDAIRSHAKYLKRKDRSKERRKMKSEDKTTDADLHKKDVESLKRMRNYWLNKLVEAEEKDPDRWGHSGFKELYPEEFEVTTSPGSSRTKSDERKKVKKKKKHRKRLLKRSSSSISSASSTRNSVHCENSNTEKQRLMLGTSERRHEDAQESSDSVNYDEHSSEKLRRKHHLNRSARSKKKHKRYRASKKSQNHKKYKKPRHSSESSVEEVWIERTIENNCNKAPFKSSSAKLCEKSTYVNSSSSDNFLIDSPCVQNQNLLHS